MGSANARAIGWSGGSRRNYQRGYLVTTEQRAALNAADSGSLAAVDVVVIGSDVVGEMQLAVWAATREPVPHWLAVNDWRAM